MSDLSHEDRLLLQLLQDRFPLSAVPYTDLAERLGRTESQVLARVQALREAGPLRQIGAIFDTRRLGYSSTLVALAVEPAALDGVAAAVSRHPGVSHNYARDHRFNLWLTLAVPPGSDLAREVQALARQPGVLRALALPTLRVFKIDVRLDLAAPLRSNDLSRSFGDAAAPLHEERATRVAATSEARGTEDGRETLAPADIPFVRALQEDLPLVQRPFHLLARRVGVDEAALLDAARRLLASGIMRRYGATLRHRQAGYGANAMAVWQVPAERVEAAGLAAAQHRVVSHCYERPVYPPDWPYQLYTMVHARSQDALEQTLAELREAIRPTGAAILATVKEYKKVRLRYFDNGDT